ncbi:hypothetical protein AB0D98_19435 [Streptomyces sp. NPDC047987]|uniref:hypothetical protein n=1 Tax=unclassified Streptomyces TaxID=2593676 RepID=UPI0034275473
MLGRNVFHGCPCDNFRRPQGIYGVAPERDLYVSERTAERLEKHSAPKNTSANYRSQRSLVR